MFPHIILHKVADFVLLSSYKSHLPNNSPINNPSIGEASIYTRAQLNTLIIEASIIRRDKYLSEVLF